MAVWLLIFGFASLGLFTFAHAAGAATSGTVVYAVLGIVLVALALICRRWQR